MNIREDIAAPDAPAEAPSVLVRRLRRCARPAGVVLFGGLLLSSLFALQVAALELSDRLGIFPLYGFFAINVLCGLTLTWFIYASRGLSIRPRLSAVRAVSGRFGRLRSLGEGLFGILNTRRVKARTQTPGGMVAVLLIIRRQAREEFKPKSQTASA